MGRHGRMAQGKSHIATDSLQLTNLTNSFSMEGGSTPCQLERTRALIFSTGEESWVTFANLESWRLHICNTFLGGILSCCTQEKTIALGMLCLMCGEPITFCIYNSNYSKEQCQYVVIFLHLQVKELFILCWKKK